MRRQTGLDERGASDIEITPMKRRHIRGVMAIERRVYPRPWSPSLFLSEINAGKTRCYLVALGEGRVVGYGGMMCYGDEAHITNIAVDPEQHRRRIGTRLLYGLVRQAQRMGATAVSLEVRVSNWGAQRLYERFGFSSVGVRKGYYQETNEDALVMWTDDIRTARYRELLERNVDGLGWGGERG